MNLNALKGEIVKKGMTIKACAEKIGMADFSLERRLKGEIEFKQNEILRISEVLKLTDEEIIEIFFDDKVS